MIIPALNIVGKDYETGKIFLPQLIQSAETTKKAFEVVKETFSANDGEEKGPIIIATVEGDIHDIGKNIVKVVLESYGYKIIDLGKDVKVEKVVEAYKKYKPKAIGLSALMTTTVASMERTIKALHEAGCSEPIWVGGAVVTEDIAQNIGADYYTEDAMAAVNLLENVNFNFCSWPTLDFEYMRSLKCGQLQELKNLSGVYVECYRSLIYVVVDRCLLYIPIQ